MLFLVLAVNFMDRQILGIPMEPIKQELAVSDTQMGLPCGQAAKNQPACVEIQTEDPGYPTE